MVWAIIKYSWLQLVKLSTTYFKHSRTNNIEANIAPSSC